MALLGSDFDPTTPEESSPVSLGAAAIRDLKARLAAFVATSFDPETGAILATATPNKVTTPYGSVGQVYTSAGPGTPPTWSTSTGVPTGAMFAFPGLSTAIPAGYLECDGSLKAIATYPALAAVLGTIYDGDGVSDFGLPDMRGRVVVGLGTSDADGATAWGLGQKKGAETHALAIAELPTHSHPTAWKQFSGQHQNGTQATGIYPVVTGLASPTATGTTGDGTAHANVQPSLGLRYIIKT